jgi:hypothetical protein
LVREQDVKRVRQAESLSPVSRAPSLQAPNALLASAQCWHEELAQQVEALSRVSLVPSRQAPNALRALPWWQDAERTRLVFRQAQDEPAQRSCSLVDSLAQDEMQPLQDGQHTASLRGQLWRPPQYVEAQQRL